METDMKKHDNSLFKIGEIVDILGVTRKTILVYEEMGLLKPALFLPFPIYLPCHLLYYPCLLLCHLSSRHSECM